MHTSISMRRQNQNPHGKYECLEAKNQRVNQAHGVDNVVEASREALSTMFWELGGHEYTDPRWHGTQMQRSYATMDRALLLGVKTLGLEAKAVWRSDRVGDGAWLKSSTTCAATTGRPAMKRELVLNGNPMEEIVGFARAVRVGPTIAVGETAPVGPDGKTVGVGDVTAQAERCFEIITDALARAGSGWHDVVRTRLILVNIDDWKAVVDVRAKYCREAKPVDTIMQITRFVNPEWLVEVEVDAVVAE